MSTNPYTDIKSPISINYEGEEKPTCWWVHCTLCDVNTPPRRIYCIKIEYQGWTITDIYMCKTCLDKRFSRFMEGTE